MKRNYLLLMALSLIILIQSCKKQEDKSSENLTIKTKSTAEVAFPKVKGEIIILKSGIVIEKKLGQFIWQGDILLTEDQYKLLDEKGTLFPDQITTLQKVSGSTGKIMRANTEKIMNVGINPGYGGVTTWSMMRYTFAPGLSSYTRSMIEQAIAYYEANTNVRFYDATGEPTVDPTYGFNYPYVEFFNGDGNYSNVGLIGGKQQISIDLYEYRVGVVLHEIGHALGLYHEQCRPDRDSYLDINFANIVSGKSSNFNKVTQNYTTIGAFDFGSIMLYSSYDFAANTSVPVMTKKDGSTFTAQRDNLSINDMAWANNFYYPYTLPQAPAFTTPVQGAVPFYEYYDPIGGGHSYSTKYASENYSGILGYVFTSQQQNTVPLYKYFNYSNRKYHYSLTNASSISGYSYLGVAAYVYANQITKSRPVFQHYNAAGDHYLFDGAGTFEGYTFEDIKFYILQNPQTTIYPLPEDDTMELYQYYSNAGDHFYTTLKKDRSGFTYEKILAYVYSIQKPGTIPLHRYYTSVSTSKDHYYTTVKQNYGGYTYEGLVGYVYPNAGTIGTSPIYSYYASVNGDHYYNTINSSYGGYLNEGIKFYMLTYNH